MAKAKETADIPQAKILRVFQLIGLLKSGGRTVNQLAQQLDANARTIYRYFKLLEELGFMIDQDFHGKFFIHREEGENPEDRFSLEEVTMMRQLLQSGASGHPLQEAMLRKLSFHSEARDLPEQFLKMRVAKLFRTINEAIEGKKQILLKSYHSANSQEINDRLVEPFQFGEGFQSVLALDTKDKQSKYFKLERIGEVVVLDKPYKFEALHQKNATDMFGLSGRKQIWVSMRLSLKACMLLREEFPLSVKYIEKDNESEGKSYLFNGPVLHFKGIGRFVMGLADEITISSPPEFKQYIKDIIKQQKLI
ncbi:WYL domain-containing protein [Chryseotalea sanaruensis]|jgi:predicted DNA-binding transcriptional regulator YafY|uniref:WYL domain-containing protein n=1 Tax=Chryseotalea sanaruensis TaxID=2482724 RepID=A0A401U9B0_9BACT|nr:WYL domain-containing protein [Chryseotalea sanaruensis]GCC51469.1 WYL domain-containing protein [Chryseotalea sanaruensis]